ncbi:M14 family metallopeptidase [Sungkyunkwania multivorans]|uniref:M14 family metallopeptidase n=1 Tax=Sungkyunkwania multivorans TaxID=1173618 RepID=A0ABW3D178_9FLAO
MKKYVLLLLILVSCKIEKDASTFDFITPFEASGGTETATYDQVVSFYENLALTYRSVKLRTGGRTDSGERLQLVIINPSPETNFNNIGEEKRVILINNGIHPGESDGIDATMMLFRDIAQGKIPMPENTVLATIPIYNIGGALNRNASTRANQNGPKEYGFRGNARNYDLNRDFIKADTRNASAFAKIFHTIKPDVFIDNHVSNGADYQYVLTHLFTQHDKLGGELGNYLHTEMMPTLERTLAAKKWDITPYVNVWGTTPEKGFSQFLDLPRYSTGYTSLWNTLGMMVETHMLKPYNLRVEGTYELMKSMIAIVERDHEKIKQLRQRARDDFAKRDTYAIEWSLDESKSTKIDFKGYEGKMIPSKVTEAERLKYDQSKPFEVEVAYQNRFKPSKEVTVPKAYIISRAWSRIIERLENNKVEMEYIEDETTMEVEVYHIDSYETRKSAYEGHYPHYNTKVRMNKEMVTFPSDKFLIIKTDQPAFRYLLETLEPEAPDSFFNWNFFDTILQQKEGFSPYVWEDKALELLSKNDELRAEFEKKKRDDEAFSSNWYAQLDWIYKRSEHYEKAHMRYPVYRVSR